MKKAILILFFIANIFTFAQIPTRDEPKDVMSYFKGDWLIIYKTNPGGDLNETQGRGESECKLIFNEITAEFSSKVKVLTGYFDCKQIFGFDKALQTYTLTIVNGDALPPVILNGKFDTQNHKLILFGYSTNYEETKVKFKMDVVFERDDKFVLHFYQIDQDANFKPITETKLFEYAFIRK